MSVTSPDDQFTDIPCPKCKAFVGEVCRDNDLPHQQRELLALSRRRLIDLRAYFNEAT